MDGFPADQYVGRALVIRNAKNVTIRNGRISGFKIGIYAENCPGLVIENMDVSNNYRQHLKSTPEKEDESDWLYGHENDNNEWLRYGAGIYLLRCDGATVKNCRARNGQNGICLVRCNDVTVVGNDMSFYVRLGLAMWRSNRCKVIGNRFDYCVRGYSHGVYARGQDSAGILVYEQCSDNVFAYNHATHGGDGFFLYAGNETVNKTGEGGCNRNLLYQNDFSYAVANGIEVTFSNQNILIGNTITNCAHGVWGGYSNSSQIVNNQFTNCHHGVSIEHGSENFITNNSFIKCTNGIWVWWDDDKALLASAFCKKRLCRSESESVIRNSFDGCGTSILAQQSDKIRILGNRFRSNLRVLNMTGRAGECEFVWNIIEDGTIENKSTEVLSGIENRVASGVATSGPVDLGNSGQPSSEPDALKKLPTEKSASLAADWYHWLLGQDNDIPVLKGGPPVRMGKKPLGPLPSIPEGKEHILITEWGPSDFTGPRPSRVATTQSVKSP
jgi:parallel beta-helix repeat protein